MSYVDKTVLPALVLISGLTMQTRPVRVPGPTAIHPATIRVNVDVTLVNTTVTDPEGRNVTGLTADSFQLWEDKVEQKIEYFSTEDFPVSIGLVFDVSGSMNSKYRLAREAAAGFLQTTNRRDELFLLEFSSRPHLIEDFTADIERVERSAYSNKPMGSTALYDAVHAALERVRHGHRARKALLLISDGQDNYSRYGFRDIMDYVKEQDVPIYAIGTLTERYSPHSLGHPSGEQILKGLTQITGGYAWFATSTRDLPDICRSIEEELRNQYVIGYRSTNATSDGKWRKIRLKVTPPAGVSRVTVRAKSGYYASRVAAGR